MKTCATAELMAHTHTKDCWLHYEPCGEHHRHDYSCGGGRRSKSCPLYRMHPTERTKLQRGVLEDLASRECEAPEHCAITIPACLPCRARFALGTRRVKTHDGRAGTVIRQGPPGSNTAFVHLDAEEQPGYLWLSELD
jgi:hypothetical protein